MTDKDANAWVKYKIKTYEQSLARIANLKRKLYVSLLNKIDGKTATDNEIELCTVLSRDRDIQATLDKGYTRGVDRKEK